MVPKIMLEGGHAWVGAATAGCEGQGSASRSARVHAEASLSGDGGAGGATGDDRQAAAAGNEVNMEVSMRRRK